MAAAATPASAAVLWSSNYATSGLSAWQAIQQPDGANQLYLTAGFGGIGTPVLRAQVDPGDRTVNSGYVAERAEVYARTPPTKMSAVPAAQWPDPVGSVRYYSVAIYLRPGFAIPYGDAGWVSLLQLKGLRGGQPPLALLVADGNFVLKLKRSSKIERSLGPATTGKWVQFVFGVKHSAGNDGWVQAYRDGKSMVGTVAVPTMDYVNGAVDPTYLKEGVYRGDGFKTSHVAYFSDTVVATAASDVLSTGWVAPPPSLPPDETPAPAAPAPSPAGPTVPTASTTPLLTTADGVTTAAFAVPGAGSIPVSTPLAQRPVVQIPPTQERPPRPAIRPAHPEPPECAMQSPARRAGVLPGRGVPRHRPPVRREALPHPCVRASVQGRPGRGGQRDRDRQGLPASTASAYACSQDRARERVPRTCAVKHASFGCYGFSRGFPHRAPSGAPHPPRYPPPRPRMLTPTRLLARIAGATGLTLAALVASAPSASATLLFNGSWTDPTNPTRVFYAAPDASFVKWDGAQAVTGSRLRTVPNPTKNSAEPAANVLRAEVRAGDQYTSSGYSAARAEVFGRVSPDGWKAPFTRWPDPPAPSATTASRCT